MKKNLVILLISACTLVLLSKPAAAQVSVGVTISAGFAPPPLPVYEQPPCPVDGYLWCPGYWAYTDDGYFWVPGVWVIPPRYGYLWTPPWWGFEAGVYGFHPGYWAPHVGFYGGVNYGFGYWGSGFVGGRWDGNHFRYNTAVVNVNRTVIHNVYVDKTVIVKNTRSNRRISYNGGPGGVTARPGSQERATSGESHLQPTVEQTTQVQHARISRAQFASVNHGQPATIVMKQPGSPIRHESGRTQAIPPANSPTVNRNPQHAQLVNSNPHTTVKNTHMQKQNQPPSIPQHYNPLALPKSVSQDPSHPQRQEYSRSDHPNPQMQHPAPQQERRATQHHPPTQPLHQPNEPHSPPPHNPEKNR